MFNNTIQNCFISSTSKNQNTTQVDIISQRMTTSNKQQPTSKHPITTIQMSPNSKTSVSSNTSTKVSQPTKQIDQKQQLISNNQHTSSMKLPVVTVTQLQSVNKQTISNPTSKSSLISVIPTVTKQLISQPVGIYIILLNIYYFMKIIY